MGHGGITVRPPSGTGASGRTAPPIERRLWGAAVAAGLASYLDAAALLTLSFSLAIWRDRFDLSFAEVGILAGGFGFAVAVGAVVGGWLGDRWGRQRVFAYDMVVFAVGTASALGASTGPALTVSLVVVGLAAGADIPTSLAVISDAAPDGTRGRLVGLTQALWILGLLTTSLLGFAVSTLGFLGTQLLLWHLLGLALVAVLLRGARAFRLEPGGAGPPGPSRQRTWRLLTRPDSRRPLLATGAFFVVWNTAASTLGSYGVYFAVTVTGLSQSAAASLAVFALPLSLATAVAFTRLAESKWRDRLYLPAAVLQVLAYAVAALTGGTALWGMVALIVGYSLSNVFAGEAAYKVWSHLLLPADVRSSGLGLTYGLGRGCASAFLLAVPLLIEWAPAGLLWLLSGFAALAGVVGGYITRRLLPSTGSGLAELGPEPRP